VAAHRRSRYWGYCAGDVAGQLEIVRRLLEDFQAAWAPAGLTANVGGFAADFELIPAA
jgi:hypothetical protein